MRLSELQRDDRAWRKAAYEVSVILRSDDSSDPETNKQIVQLIKQAAKDFGWTVARWNITESSVNFIFYVSEEHLGLQDWQYLLVKQGARFTNDPGTARASIIGKQLRRLGRGKTRFRVASIELNRPGQPMERKGSVSSSGWVHEE